MGIRKVRSWRITGERLETSSFHLRMGEPMNQERTPAFKVRPNALAELNDSAMYALFVAAVPEVDREGEIVPPDIIDTSEWELNPIWLWAHDQKQLPIGAGYTPAGEVACYKSKTALRLGCRFS